MKAKNTNRVAPVPITAPTPTREQIEALAHAIWIDRGRPEGRDLDNWLEAERQLLRGEVRAPESADDIPATNDTLEPDRAVKGKLERELDRVTTPSEQRSPTSL